MACIFATNYHLYTMPIKSQESKKIINLHKESVTEATKKLVYLCGGDKI